MALASRQYERRKAVMTRLFSQPNNLRRLILWFGATLGAAIISALIIIYFDVLGNIWLITAIALAVTMLTPILIVFGLSAAWYVAPFYILLTWKYFALLEGLTGLSWGSRIGRSILRDPSFVNARPGTPYAWVYGLALRKHGAQESREDINA
jgi:hypothetical protein